MIGFVIFNLETAYTIGYIKALIRANQAIFNQEKVTDITANLTKAKENTKKINKNTKIIMKSKV